MMKSSLLTFLFLLSAARVRAYVPTVESLFRNGANPDATTTAVVLAAKLYSFNPYLEETGATSQGEPLWVRWIYNITPQGKLKLTQLCYRNQAMTDAHLVDKVYLGELDARSFSGASARPERGLFLGLLNSLLINDGSFVIEFLKLRGVEVKANSELIDQEKVALLQRYKQWLTKTRGGRVANGEESPLTPSSAAERERVEQLLNAPMYRDTQQVTLSRHRGEPAWSIRADGFEAWVGDERRDIRQFILRTTGEEVELSLQDYVLLNGTNFLPRTVQVRLGEEKFWMIEFLGVRPFNESGTEMLSRLKRYDQLLGKPAEALLKPPFLL